VEGVAAFTDPYGNRWDLIEVKQPSRSGGLTEGVIRHFGAAADYAFG
jgi:hypothetical protein